MNTRKNNWFTDEELLPNPKIRRLIFYADYLKEQEQREQKEKKGISSYLFEINTKLLYGHFISFIRTIKIHQSIIPRLFYDSHFYKLLHCIFWFLLPWLLPFHQN